MNRNSRLFVGVLAAFVTVMIALAFLVGYRIGDASTELPQSCATAMEAGHRYITGLEAMVDIKIDYIALITQPYVTEYEKDFLAEVQDNQIAANDKAVIEYFQAKRDCDKELG